MNMELFERVYPSIYSSDHLRLLEELRRVEGAGFTHLHVDIQDSSLGLNVSFGMKVVWGLNALTGMKLQVHLMVAEPLHFVEELKGLEHVDEVLFHPGPVAYPGRVLNAIRALGLKAGFALTPVEPLEELAYYRGRIDSILIWTGEPDGGNGKFDQGALQKVARARDMFGEKTAVFTDGDMNNETIPQVAAAGASHFIMGRDIFGVGNLQEKVYGLEQLMGKLG